jgi:pimeloyl-ACP methyl ester carboxylesterase
VLVHGAITNGPAAWSKQRPLADRWQLVVVNRPGFAPNPPEQRCDFEADAAALARILDEAGHLVGHSYGGLIALLAAEQRPDAVLSLTLIEPAVTSLLRGDLEVEQSITDHLSLIASHGHDARSFLAAFTARLGGDPGAVPDPLPDQLRQHVELLIHERYPWEAVITTDTLAAAPMPKLVVSGGHSAMQEALCDALAARLGATAERAVIEGAGHNVQRTGAKFNERLEQLLISANH